MSPDNLNKWLALVANIGVLIGVFFLAIELNQNTNISRSDSYQQILNSINEWRSYRLEDPELDDVWYKFTSRRFNELSDFEIRRVRILASYLMDIYDNALYSFNSGVITEQEMDRFLRPGCNIWTLINESDGFPRQGLIDDNLELYLKETC